MAEVGFVLAAQIARNWALLEEASHLLRRLYAPATLLAIIAPPVVALPALRIVWVARVARAIRAT